MGLHLSRAGSSTLQDAYDASSSPEITLAASPGGVTLQDNATPLGTNLFDVRDNLGAVVFGVSIATPVTTRVVNDVGQNQITLNANPVLSTARPWAGINFLAPIDAAGTAIFDSARIYSGFAAGSGFDKAYLVLGTGSGVGTWTSPVTIRASRVGINTGGGDVLPFGILVVRDLGVPATRIFSVENNTPNSVFIVNEDEMSIGLESRRLFRAGWSDPAGRIGMEFLPDDMTVTSAGGESFAAIFTSVNRTITLNIPGGGGIGNDTAPGAMNFAHTARFEDTGFLFAAQLLVNAAVKIECATNTVGPLYLFLDQYVTYADGGARTCTQHNAMRAQPTWGPNINGGSITQTSAELFFAACTVNGTVGSSTVTLMNYFACKAPNLVAGGTITTLNCIDIPNIPAAGITTLTGIFSQMSSGTFINQQGTAVSIFAGDIHINNAVEFHLGSVGAFGRVTMSRVAVGTMRMIGTQATNNEGLDWNFEGTAGAVQVTTSTAADLWFNLTRVALGTTSPVATNWFLGISPPAFTTVLAGDFAHVLNTSGGTVTVDHALSNLFQQIINAPTGTIGTGSVTDSGVVLIQANANVGTNRYGLLIRSNPSGGTLNYALRCTAGDARFDARVDINNGIALGGGAAPTLGTIGGAGPTAAAQAQWVEIDINGVAHWIPVWT